MSKDITYCGYSKCPNTDCERHATHSTMTYDSFAYFHDCDKYPPMEFSQDNIKRMKLIIDIPEYLYENIKRSMDNDTESLYVGEQAIANGTPLAEFCDSCIYKKDEDD